MKSFEEQLIENINRPCQRCFLYEVGQKVRVRKGRSFDGQTPEYWDGALGKIVYKNHTLFSKTHFYRIQHLENNKICEFEEYELDRRYIRKK